VRLIALATCVNGLQLLDCDLLRGAVELYQQLPTKLLIQDKSFKQLTDDGISWDEIKVLQHHFVDNLDTG
jgi:hypothetical protein